MAKLLNIHFSAGPVHIEVDGWVEENQLLLDFRIDSDCIFHWGLSTQRTPGLAGSAAKCLAKWNHPVRQACGAKRVRGGSGATLHHPHFTRITLCLGLPALCALLAEGKEVAQEWK